MDATKITAALVALAAMGGCDDVEDRREIGDPPLDADGGTCEPLNLAPEDELVISFEPQVSLRPGESYQFGLSLFRCCYWLEPVDACVDWSVSPAVASITSDGILTVASDAAPGTVLTVTAEVDGRRIEARVDVYTRESNPLVGKWYETAQRECETGVENAPADPIWELMFRADGTFAVSWTPFEIYEDYWGTYDFDLELGRLELMVEGGNYVPDDIDPAGRFRRTDDELILRSLWLGSSMEVAEPVGCGQRFSGPDFPARSDGSPI